MVKDGKATFTVDISDHGSELGCYYRIHLYLYDNCSNYTAVAVPDVLIEDEAPEITDIEVVNVSERGYTIKCKVSDSGSGISRVSFPSWTLNKAADGNEQDDLSWKEGEVKDGIATFTVKTSDHGDELGTYRTHVYGWGKMF